MVVAKVAARVAVKAEVEEGGEGRTFGEAVKDSRFEEREDEVAVLAHEIRARAIACALLGYIGHVDPMRSGRKEGSRGYSFCARGGGLKLCCPER